MWIQYGWFRMDKMKIKAKIILSIVFIVVLVGIIAIISTNIPIPPTKWVKHLQKFIHFDKDVTSDNIVAPVVVNPDTVSKSSSIKLGIDFLN